jgi:hypothetical protein
MNLHAEKIDTRVPSDSPEGGALVEVHTCPACRYVGQRPAGATAAPLS